MLNCSYLLTNKWVFFQRLMHIVLQQRIFSPVILHRRSVEINLHFFQNVLIEATATDEYKAIVTVNQIVAAFSFYCKDQFTCATSSVLIPGSPPRQLLRLWLTLFAGKPD